MMMPMQNSVVLGVDGGYVFSHRAFTGASTVTQLDRDTTDGVQVSNSSPPLPDSTGGGGPNSGDYGCCPSPRMQHHESGGMQVRKSFENGDLLKVTS
jgi:hypothetical protein